MEKPNQNQQRPFITISDKLVQRSDGKIIRYRTKKIKYGDHEEVRTYPVYLGSWLYKPRNRKKLEANNGN